jgi:hypothetical protein
VESPTVVYGSVFAQPLLIPGFKFPDGSVHDVLLARNSFHTQLRGEIVRAPMFAISDLFGNAQGDMGSLGEGVCGIHATSFSLRISCDRIACY